MAESVGPTVVLIVRASAEWFVLDLIIASALLLLVVGHGLLIYACHDLRKNGDSVQTSWADRVEVIHDLLEEVIDAVDAAGASVPTGPAAVAGGGIQEILTGLLMDRVTSAMTHGTQEEQAHGEIDEGQHPQESEVGPQPHEHG